MMLLGDYLLSIITCKRQFAFPSQFPGSANLSTQIYLPYPQYYPYLHFNGSLRHVFYLWVRPKKNDSVKGYDESSPRIFMARPTPSRAASCSPCVHQYKTDNVELMQRHVVQIFLGVKLLVFLTQIICLFFVHIMQYDINWA